MRRLKETAQSATIATSPCPPVGGGVHIAALARPCVSGSTRWAWAASRAALAVVFPRRGAGRGEYLVRRSKDNAKGHGRNLRLPTGRQRRDRGVRPRLRRRPWPALLRLGLRLLGLGLGLLGLGLGLLGLSLRLLPPRGGRHACAIISTIVAVVAEESRDLCSRASCRYSG